MTPLHRVQSSQEALLIGHYLSQAKALSEPLKCLVVHDWLLEHLERTLKFKIFKKKVQRAHGRQG